MTDERAMPKNWCRQFARKVGPIPILFVIRHSVCDPLGRVATASERNG